MCTACKACGMNFVQLIQSLDDLLYEIMSWFVFFPVTLWRTVRRPLAMMDYAHHELQKPADKQYSETISPPLFLLLALFISHALELASGGGTNPIVSDTRGLASFVDSDTKLLLLRLVIFSMIPLMLAMALVILSKSKLSDETLKAPFYAQCYPAAPFALTVGLGGLLLGHGMVLELLGAGVVLLAISLYFITQIIWFRQRLERGILAGALYAGVAIVGGMTFCNFPRDSVYSVTVRHLGKLGRKRGTTMRLRIFPIALLGIWNTAASAQTPPDIADLIGARAAGGEAQLEARGYANVGGEASDDRKWTYWWNARTQTCVTVSTLDGRYDAITASPAPDCNHSLQQTRPSSRPATASNEDRWFDIGLICYGEGQRPAVATRYGYFWDHDKGRYTYGNRTELTAQDFDASVTIQIWDGGGRIRLPKRLIPPIHSRGDHGWWELDEVSTGPNVIRAEYRLNGMNKPNVTIDRRSGHISIKGMGDYAFTGSCDSADNQQRRF